MGIFLQVQTEKWSYTPPEHQANSYSAGDSLGRICDCSKESSSHVTAETTHSLKKNPNFYKIKKEKTQPTKLKLCIFSEHES